jgi:hypothetical protein
MASAGVFKIIEHPPGGLPGEGELFSWTAGKEATTETATHGGVWAAPQGPWNQPEAMRLVRTDYTGAKSPSFQVLGPVVKSWSWTGEWKDKFNFPGYAMRERDRFRAMCRRGNHVQVKFLQESYWGIIEEWEFKFVHKARIGYTFTFNPSSRDGEEDLGRTPDTVEQPDQAIDDLNILAASTAKAHASKPAWATSTPIISDVSKALAGVSNRLADMSSALSTTQGVLKPISDAKNLAIQLRSLQGDCSRVVLQLVAARSDIDLGIRTAKSVLDFEAWNRNTCNLMRLAAGRSRNAADAMAKRNTPAAMGIYRPFKGEHIYSVSRKAYGTPNAWQGIFRANHLTALVFQGNETLVIPANGAV